MATAFQDNAFQVNAFQIDSGAPPTPQESFGSRHTVPPPPLRHIPPVRARFGLALDVDVEWDAVATTGRLPSGQNLRGDVIVQAQSAFEAQLIAESREAQIRMTLGISGIRMRGMVRRKDS